MVHSEPQPSRNEVFDAYFGVGLQERKGAASRFQDVEEAVAKIGPELLEQQFLHVFNLLRETLKNSDKSFVDLVLPGEKGRFPRYFQVVFLALYDILVRDDKELVNPQLLAKKLKNSGASMDIPGGGGTWSAENKANEIARMKGLLQTAFRKRRSENPAVDSWVTQFENILTQSRTEQTLYDFKVGLVRVDKKQFDDNAFSKVVKTLAAVANHGPGTTGYVIVGVGEPPAIVQRASVPREFNGFKIPGVQSDLTLLGIDEDAYFSLVNNKLRSQPISDEFRTALGRNLRFIHYYGSPILIFKVEAASEPVIYEKNYYGRNGSNTEELTGTALADLFKRFLIK